MGLLGLNEVDLGRFRWQPATKPSFKQESNLKTEILTNTQNYATILENYPRKSISSYFLLTTCRALSAVEALSSKSSIVEINVASLPFSWI